MNTKISKTASSEKIEKFFKDIKNKTPKEIKKIKQLAMAKSLPLKEKRKLFCKKCLIPYSGKEKVSVKNKVKKVTCNSCGYIGRWNLI